MLSCVIEGFTGLASDIHDQWFLLRIYLSIFILLTICWHILLPCICVHHMHAVPEEAREDIGSPGSGITGCVSHRVDAGNQTQVSTRAASVLNG